MTNIDKRLPLTWTNEQYRQNEYPSHGHMNNIDKAIILYMDK